QPRVIDLDFTHMGRKPKFMVNWKIFAISGNHLHVYRRRLGVKRNMLAVDDLEIVAIRGPELAIGGLSRTAIEEIWPGTFASSQESSLNMPVRIGPPGSDFRIGNPEDATVHIEPQEALPVILDVGGA